MDALVSLRRSTAFILSLIAAAALSGRIDAQRFSVQEKAIEGRVSFVIDSSPRGAKVDLNGERAGTTPLALSGYPPGSYDIALSLEGYKDRSIRVNAVEGTQYAVMAELVPRRGFLMIEANPPGTEISIDGQKRSEGTHYLPVGRHLVAARLFGYEGQETEIFVYESFPQSVRFDLAKAVFALGAASFSRPRFNPRSPGSLGKTVFSFDASAPGSGRLRILSPEGETLFEREFSFTTWEQSHRWDGRGPDGEKLADGEYLFIVEARGEDQAESSISLGTKLDSTARLEPRALSSGVPGYALCPSAAVLPSRDAELGFGAGFPILEDYSSAALPFWTGLRVAIADPVEIFVSFHGAAGPGAVSGLAANAGLKWQFAKRPGGIGFDAALYGQGATSLSGPLGALGSDSDGSAVSLGSPLGFTAGLFDLALSPAFFLSIPRSSGLGYGASVSAAFGVQTPSFDIHLSANAKYTIGQGVSWPIRSAIDARFVPDFAPCSMSAGFILDFGRDGSLSPSLTAGLSVLI